MGSLSPHGAEAALMVERRLLTAVASHRGARGCGLPQLRCVGSQAQAQQCGAQVQLLMA